ncbi:MAG: M6 family metalloprotease domain-containing protein [Bacteroidaceae bacterium]|nr:M6 family metalloprotease domain-containing protein [Bacteroidaceae bacterium]
MIKKLLSTLLLVLSTYVCWSIPADRTPRKIQQPDGTFVTLRLNGDEYFHYTTTADGFTVVKNERGFWVYASKQADGTLAATNVVAHDEADRQADEKAFLNGTTRRIKPQMDSRMAEMRQGNRMRQAQALEKRRAEGFDYSNFRGLIILVEYNDRSFQYGDEMNDIMNDIANKEGYKGDSRTNYVDESKGIDGRFYGSVYDYFRDNSNGKFQPKFDVVGPVKVNQSQYFPRGVDYAPQLVKEVVDVADPLVDFSQYDGNGDGVVDLIYFVFAGFASHNPANDERLMWAHKSHFVDEVKDGVKLVDYTCSTEMEVNEELPMLTGIGTICHELSHVLGLPDFYDTDYEGSGGQSDDLLYWSLMSAGDDLAYGRVPCNYSLYERYLVGFCDKPTVLNEVGTYSMHDVTTNEGFWLDTSRKNEFFIIENRQQTGWDTYLPGHGMLVFRVDRSDMDKWNDNCINVDPKRQYYEMLYAGGYRGGNSPYESFPGKGNVTMLTNYSSPANLRTWAGRENKFGIVHIAETDGIISFDLVDASTFAEIVLPQQQDMYQGICYELERGIYVPKKTYQAKWTSDNPEVASVDQEGNVTAMAEGEAQITLTVNDSLSATCAVTVQPAPAVPNIESLFNYPSKTPQVLQLNDAQVFFVYLKNRAFVRDGSGSIMLYDILPDAVPGDVLNGLLYSKYFEDTGWIEMDPIKGINYVGSIQVTHGPTPEPDVVTLANMGSCKIMDYITLKDVKLEYRTNSKGVEQLSIADGEHTIFLNTKYIGNMDMPTKQELSENRYDVEGIISYYNTPGYNDVINLTAPIAVSQNTGIAAPVSASQPCQQIYNLQGQRLSRLQKGLNILNGKILLHP